MVRFRQPVQLSGRLEPQSRRKRIALGSGNTVQEVKNLLHQHTQMSKLFKGMTGGMKAQQHLMSQMQGKHRFGR